MRVLSATECVADLLCPACGCERLAAGADGVGCDACGREFPCRHGVVDFVVAGGLDRTGVRERSANAVALDSEKTIGRKLRKSTATSPLLLAQMRRSIRGVDRLLAPADEERTLFSLGSGFGFELPLLFECRTFARVFSSDIAWSATALVPNVTQRLDGDLGLFAADFDHLPIARRDDRIGLVFLALHHAEDPHRTLAGLLERNFDHLVLVEPLDNWLVDILAALGLARRVEYSGTRPQWLHVRRMRQIAADQGFEMRVETWWEIPRSALPRRLRKSRRAWRPLVAVVEAISLLLRPLRFGSMGAISFRRLGTPAPAAPRDQPSAARR